ncbi:unnamed protein product [Urochloa humidicola]
MFALISFVLIAVMAVWVCWMMAMELWEYCNTLETKAQSPDEEKEL